MANVLEILVKAQDMASGVLEGIGSTAEETGSFIENNWGKISAVTGAAGAAMEGFARSQADTNAIVSRASIVTGENEDAIRATIDSLSSWNFSAEDVARGMEELIRRGVDTTEGFEAILPAVDDFADATGRDVVDAIGILDSTLSALGIPLEEAGDHVDTFTLLSERSTIPLEQMERQLGKVGPELQEMGIGLDETAGFLLALEGKGLSGKEALREFAKATEQADGDIEQLKEILGLTDEELAQYQEQVANAEGMTREFADANNATTTPLEKLQAGVGNLMSRFGGLASVASTAAPALMGVAAVMPALAAAKQGVTAATGALSKAMAFLAANPIILIIAAIAALVAAIIWLWNNNEAFREFIINAWNAIKDMFGVVWDAIVDFIKEAWERIQDIVTFAWERVIKPIWEAIRFGIDLIIEAVKIYIQVWKEIFQAAGSILKSIWDNVIRPVWDAFKRGIGAVGDAAKAAWDNVIKPTWDAIKRGVEMIGEAIDTFKGAWSTAWTGIKNAVRGPANGIIGFINSVLTGVERLVNGVGSAINRLPSFTVPGWIPGIGGRTFSLPHIPSVSLPRVPSLARGGIALATPGGFLAQIAEGGRNERIQPLGGPDDPMEKMVRLLEMMLMATRDARVLSVDGRELADAIGGPFVEEIRSRTGL